MFVNKLRFGLREAEPSLSEDLEVIASHSFRAFEHAYICFLLKSFDPARDQTVFNTQYFAGDRASKSFQSKAADVFSYVQG